MSKKRATNILPETNDQAVIMEENNIKPGRENLLTPFFNLNALENVILFFSLIMHNMQRWQQCAHSAGPTIR